MLIFEDENWNSPSAQTTGNPQSRVVSADNKSANFALFHNRRERERS